MLQMLLLRDGTSWEVYGKHEISLPIEPYSYRANLFPAELHKKFTVNIPNGFNTDLDTIPRIPIFYQWLKNRTVTAAAWHDFFYSSGYPRKWADEMFLYLMEKEGVRKRYRLPIYWGVRLFGQWKFANKRGRLPWHQKHLT